MDNRKRALLWYNERKYHNGVPLKQIQEWPGHSDFSTTANIYAHLYMLIWTINQKSRPLKQWKRG